MYGYDHFDATSFTTSFTGAINQKEKSLVRNMKEYLAVLLRAGGLYVPWMNDTYVNAVLQSTEGMLKLSTPPGSGTEADSIFSASESLRSGCEK